MKVLLTTVPSFFELDPSVVYRGNPPLALYGLASLVERAGHAVHVLDPIELYSRFEQPDWLLSFLRTFDVIGLSANSGNWPLVKMLLDALEGWKEAPTIVLGGIHPTLLDRHVLETTPARCVVRDEGDRTFPELLDALAGKVEMHSVAGLSFRENGRIYRNADRPPLSTAELGELPLPDFNWVPRDTYYGLPVESSRGCRFNCIFCSIVGKSSWRAFPLQNVLDRIDHAVTYVERMRHSHLFFVDDCFTSDRERLVEILGRCHQKSPLDLGLEGRVTDILKPGVAGCLARTNVRFMQLGVECGYEEGLKRVRKGLTLEHVRACARLLAETRLIERAKFSYIVGFPWESREMMEETIHFAYETATRWGGTVQVNWLTVFPGSEIYAQRQMHGIAIEDADFDRLDWQTSSEIFQSTHPNITIDDQRYLAGVLSLMKRLHPEIELHSTVLGLKAGPAAA